VCYIAFFALVAAGTLAFWRAEPRLLGLWSEKGGLLERLGPTLVFLGALSGVLLGRAHRSVGDSRAWGWYGFAAFLGFLLMEEIGWGYEIFYYPRIEVGGIPVDSFHDLLRLLRRMGNESRNELLQHVGIALSVGAAGVVLSPWGRSRLLPAVNPNIVLILLLSTVPIAAALLFDARLTDIVWFLRRNPPYWLEEYAEVVSEALLVLVVVEGWASHLTQQARSESVAVPAET